MEAVMEQADIRIPGDILLIKKNRQNKTMTVIKDFYTAEEAINHFRVFAMEKIANSSDAIYMDDTIIDSYMELPGFEDIRIGFNDNDRAAGYYSKRNGNPYLFSKEIKHGFTQFIWVPDVEDYELVILTPVALPKKKK